MSAALRARAVLLGDRLAIERARYSRVVSTAPFCYQLGDGYVVGFRYGAVVLVGLSEADEKRALAWFGEETVHAIEPEEERVSIALEAVEEGPNADGILRLQTLDLSRVLVLANILAKSVALARYEREIAQVFDTIEPEARAMADNGRLPRARRPLLRLIGSALLAQHRVAGRIAFAEKPDVLWDHPELGRLYAKLEDEYEIVERGTLLGGKLEVIGTVAETFTDMIDTARSARLEILITVLILAELVIAALELFR
ncbi:MAG: RMD1 family protein [Proteobacteria bacterium]|nr:RMD1 family protein [Pseudomonadota bacterium]